MDRADAPPRRRHGGRGPDDDRPTKAIAADIVNATPEQDDGDGRIPPDPDELLSRFVEAVAAVGTLGCDGGWLGGRRKYVPDAGPVPSSRFV